jgi:DNA-directed RNA polymerase subunit RPC12/RpoP
MASWMLSCNHCGKAFEHSKIRDTLANYFFAAKPDFPSDGLELECPHCGTKSIYQRTELTYRPD